MATPPSKPLSLAELNQRSARLAAFDIFIFHPRIEEWNYIDKSNNNKKGLALRCFIVSVAQRTQYAAAELGMRGNNRKPIDDAHAKFKEGLHFRMSSTRIKGNVKQEFLHTTIELFIDLSGTKFDPILQKANSDGAHLAAEPVMTNAKCKTLVPLLNGLTLHA